MYNYWDCPKCKIREVVSPYTQAVYHKHDNLIYLLHYQVRKTFIENARVARLAYLKGKKKKRRPA